MYIYSVHNIALSYHTGYRISRGVWGGRRERRWEGGFYAYQLFLYPLAPPLSSDAAALKEKRKHGWENGEI